MPLVRGVGARAAVFALLLLWSTTSMADDGLKELKAKDKVPQDMYTPIYADGRFFGSWADNSVGCTRCSWADAENSRKGSAASASLTVQPWGQIQFSSRNIGLADSVLDFWVKGSGLTAISLYIKDSATKTLSKDVRFQRADLLPAGVTIRENDDNGWLHIQVALSTLRTTGSANSTVAGGDSCITWVSQHFDRIVFADISGMGATLMLDDVKLISKDAISAASFFMPAFSMRPPVFGEDLIKLIAGRNRYTMKLKPNVTYEAVSKICQEMQGEALQPTRYRGVCNTPLSTLRHTSNKLSWSLVTFTVQSPDDLQVMRDALKDHVEWFETDLTGFTTVRSLHDAAVNGNGFDIRHQHMREVLTHDDAETVDGAPWDVEDQDLGWVSHSTVDEPPSSPKTASSPSAQPVSPVPVTPAGNASSHSTASVDAIGAATVNMTALELLNLTANSTAGSNTSEVADVTGTEQLVETLKGGATGTVEGVGKNSASVQSVSSWGLDRINQVDLPLDGYYSSGDFDGRGVHIYVLDTGLRTTHYDFRGRVGAGASAVGSSVEDDQGHGTHVSGTALGSVHGVAPSAIVHPVKVMDSKGNGAYSNIIAGIQWAKDDKVKNNYASAVISMSVAGPRSAALNDAVDAAVAAGITVVTAPGNNKGGDSCTMSPASAPSSITVGAATDTDAMASMSNIGSCLSMFAPGASASFQDDSSEVYMSGTSMAAPHVAGAAALYLQHRPGAPPAEVKAALMSAAVGCYFEASSPKLLLNVMSSRLRAAREAVAPAPKPSPSPSPKPVVQPSPSPKSIVQPSPSPKPVVKASPSPSSPPPPPPPPTPAPVPPPPALNPFPTYTANRPAICATCKWCTFMC